DIDKAVNLSADAHVVVKAILDQMYDRSVTVGEIRKAFEDHIRNNGGDSAMCYGSLVAIGQDADVPHGNSADSKVLKQTDLVMWIDAGGKVAGKCSDITRTYIFGDPSAEVLNVYLTVWEAYNRSAALMKPGAVGKDIHNAAANYISSKGYTLPHCLGHSFRTQVHEAPYSCSTSSDVMKVGDPQTNEPGIYLSGKWGMRIEDDYRMVPGGAYLMHDRPAIDLKDIIIKPKANVTRIEVAPTTATVTADQTQQFTAVGYDAQGNQVGITPQWTATGGSVSASGLLTPDKVGTFDVVATYQAKTAKATVTVTPGKTASVAVSPASATISLGQKQQFTGSTADAKGNPTQDTLQWSASGGGTIDSTGLFTSTAEGTFEITATAGTGSDKATITVEKAKTVSIAVTPKTATIAAGESVQVSAALKDGNGDPTGDVASWTASAGGTVDQTGLFTSTKPGSYTVTATFALLSDSSTVTVTPGPPKSAVVSPAAPPTIEEGSKQKFTVEVKDAFGNVIPAASLTTTWSVDSAIGTMAQDGTFTATKAGTGKVVAEASTLKGTATGSAPVTVKAKPGGGGGGGGSGGGSIADFLASPTGMVLLIVVIAAVAGIAAMMMMRRKKRPQPGMTPWDQPNQGMNDQPYWQQ
ncbi:MAG TPA: M24 family metallopeptidase, partial [Thermoplasmata archaeon]|nr:M24 family metallopeptidase [Thermoplasmata archaeon]